MSKALLLILGGVSLAQYSAAGCIHYNELELTQADSFRYNFCVQLTDMNRKILKNSKDWLENVHNEIATMTQKNETIQKFLAKAEQLLSDEDRKFNREVIAVALPFVFMSYQCLSNPDPVDEILSRYCRDVFQVNFAVDFKQCAEKVIAETKHYMDSLSSTQKQSQSSLIMLLNTFETEQDLKKKFEIFLQLSSFV